MSSGKLISLLGACQFEPIYRNALISVPIPLAATRAKEPLMFLGPPFSSFRDPLVGF